MEVSRKLTTALKLYGSDALKIFDQDAREPAPKPVLVFSTVNEYQKKWLAELDKTDVKRSTKELYSYLISNHVVPAFGKDRIDTIDYPKLRCSRSIIRSDMPVRILPEPMDNKNVGRTWTVAHGV